MFHNNDYNYYQFWSSTAAEEDVFWLDVQVNPASGVYMDQSLDQTGTYIPAYVERDSASTPWPTVKLYTTACMVCTMSIEVTHLPSQCRRYVCFNL